MVCLRNAFYCALALASFFGPQKTTCSAEPDRYWFLIHDRAVLAELKLTAAEQAAVRKEIDPLDVRFMALRGTTPEKVATELPKIIAQARQGLKKVLRPEQERRLSEVVLRVQGPTGLLRAEITAPMKFTAEQKKELEKIIGDTQQAIAELDKQIQDGKPAEPLEKESLRLRTEEQTMVFKLLTKPQQTLWLKLAGPPFDASRLGRMAFKAPELTGTKDWINSQPLTLSQLKGKVVALHFYTFG
ncbi:MAG: hypothetical protein ACR2FY_20840 [Pirellulaceae bacterium]